MDFVADQLADGLKIRTLTIIDLFTRECLGIDVSFSLQCRARHGSDGLAQIRPRTTATDLLR
jgi:putative transposase